MPTDTIAIDAIQNPRPPQTGPRTEHGKSTSSRNALKDGLFATHDFIRLGERDEYDRIAAALQKDLAPEGALEELFATEIISAAWRLRRCRLVEENFSTKFDEFDPMEDDAACKVQKSVDRARAQSHSAIRRAIAEMRRIQTERQTRSELGLKGNDGLAETLKVIKAVMNHGAKADPQPQTPAPEPGGLADRSPWSLDLNKPDEFAAFDNFILNAPQPQPTPVTPEDSTEPADLVSFCKTPLASITDTGRNAPCPCGSGMKYKKCCLERTYTPETEAA